MPVTSIPWPDLLLQKGSNSSTTKSFFTRRRRSDQVDGKRMDHPQLEVGMDGKASLAYYRAPGGMMPTPWSFISRRFSREGPAKARSLPIVPPRHPALAGVHGQHHGFFRIDPQGAGLLGTTASSGTIPLEWKPGVERRKTGCRTAAIARPA